MNLNLLVVLGALLETRSIRAAASQVALSPSATSHALGRLRELLGDELLVRAGNRMVPTPRAERLRPQVARLLEEAATVLSEERPFDPATLVRDFRIGADDYAELLVYRSLSDAIAAEAPGIALHARTHRADGVEQLRAGEVDIGIGVLRDPPADVHEEVLFEEEFVCLLRKGHPALARRLTLERYAALGHVLVSPRGTPRGVVDIVLERQGLKRRVARSVGSFWVAPRLVAESDFVLTTARRVAELLAEPLNLAIRTPPLELPRFAMKMLWHRRNEDDPAHRWLRDRIRAAN
ncbi:MAG: LysR family transcriptional regulator [Myxococcales bacterium]|nr:LysR family transcriptional regulator [Myxococcales bacterium]